MAPASAFPVSARDEAPLLLRTLCDRGARLQPDNLLVTKCKGSAGDGKGYLTITFQEHQLRSLRLGSALARWGVKIGDRVATLLWNTAWHVQCYHAVSCMGAVLHTLNLRLGTKDLGFIIDHAADRVIISDSDLLDMLGKVDSAVLDKVELFVCCGEDGVPNQWTLPSSIPRAKAIDYDSFLSTGKDDFVWPDLPETALHALCYTSGTTGVPKGAAYSQRSTYLHTLVMVGADQIGLSGSQVILPFVPMFHVLGWGVPFAGLMVGMRMVFTGRSMDPDSMLDAMLDWGVQISTGVPTVWQGVRSCIEQRGTEKVRKGLKLKMLTCGGSAPPSTMIGWYQDQLGVEFLQGWGMTETNPLGSAGRRVAKYKDLSASSDALFSNMTKAGLPNALVEVRIADPEDLDRELPRGQQGELLVRGPTIITEYFQFDAPDKPRQELQEQLVSTLSRISRLLTSRNIRVTRGCCKMKWFHRGWLITGDVAKLDEEGAIIICDRSKDVIKSGGEWISSIDLENHITGMKDIAMAAVVAVPHPRWDERPVAIVTLPPGCDPGVAKGLKERVVAHCLQAFAKFQVPDDVIVWQEIPLTSTGKLDKKVIRAMLTSQGYMLPTAAGAPSKL
ncbi:unnamed protein product [Polarella glacialis]|uniref:Long-chain fatty acid--CoA ligase n=1 Tax=Polarella glacialis TaxID=89957 RepID=A0A813EPE6_POLGL|nr:unnamed protein product [Polarella glacialis]